VTRPSSVFLTVLTLTIAGCAAVEPNLLGGRERCWNDDAEPRQETVMRGTLDLDPVVGSALDTPEGERFDIDFPVLVVKSVAGDVAVVEPGGATVATDGELVTIFGGLGSDEVIQVCAIEERHNG
jgi:hypothetical protein